MPLNKPVRASEPENARGRETERQNGRGRETEREWTKTARLRLPARLPRLVLSAVNGTYPPTDNVLFQRPFSLCFALARQRDWYSKCGTCAHSKIYSASQSTVNSLLSPPPSSVPPGSWSPSCLPAKPPPHHRSYHSSPRPLPFPPNRQPLVPLPLRPPSTPHHSSPPHRILSATPKRRPSQDT